MLGGAGFSGEYSMPKGENHVLGTSILRGAQHVQGEQHSQENTENTASPLSRGSSMPEEAECSGRDSMPRGSSMPGEAAFSGGNSMPRESSMPGEAACSG